MVLLVSLVPSPASSTKASPTNSMGGEESTDCMTILGEVGVKAENIRRKHSSQRSGPIVEPWPGPNRRHSGVLAYPEVETP